MIVKKVKESITSDLIGHYFYSSFFKKKNFTCYYQEFVECNFIINFGFDYIYNKVLFYLSLQNIIILNF